MDIKQPITATAAVILMVGSVVFAVTEHGDYATVAAILSVTTTLWSWEK